MEQILTVSELNNAIKSLLEESFDSLLVEGEVADLRRPQSGHTYFTLKDDKSQIRAVFFVRSEEPGAVSILNWRKG